jgi:hypothetical protein
MKEEQIQKVREKAYEIWVLEGRPEGRSLVHWGMAEQLVAQEDTDRSHNPPASEKWEIENAVVALDTTEEKPAKTDAPFKP